MCPQVITLYVTAVCKFCAQRLFSGGKVRHYGFQDSINLAHMCGTTTTQPSRKVSATLQQFLSSNGNPFQYLGQNCLLLGQNFLFLAQNPPLWIFISYEFIAHV